VSLCQFGLKETTQSRGRFAVLSAGLLFLLVGTPAHSKEPQEITATFSIVAFDPKTGELGAAVASKYPAVGKVVPMVKAGVGAFCTQHYHVPAWREQAIQMLEEGVPPEQVLANLLKEDDRRELRQLAIVDAQGRVAVHNPSQAPEGSLYWGAICGRYYSCQGNTLTGNEVLVEMARAYESTQGTLADRLMAALVAGDKAGGDHRGRLAAGIRVATPGKEALFALDVDNSSDAVNELANLFKQQNSAKQ
jgi:uncharacterized Ntn-hydrolase superfamily protein